LGFGLGRRAPSAASMETIWKPAAWLWSLTGAGARIPGLPFPRGFLMFVRSALNRESSTPRRETVLDGPCSDRSNLPEATIEARAPLRAAAAFVLVDRQDEARIRVVGDGEHLLLRAGSGAMSPDVNTTIVFIRKRSPAARCASESLVAIDVLCQPLGLGSGCRLAVKTSCVNLRAE
jgi:hypothetical protein